MEYIDGLVQDCSVTSLALPGITDIWRDILIMSSVMKGF